MTRVCYIVILYYSDVCKPYHADLPRVGSGAHQFYYEPCEIFLLSHKTHLHSIYTIGKLCLKLMSTELWFKTVFCLYGYIFLLDAYARSRAGWRMGEECLKEWLL